MDKETDMQHKSFLLISPRLLIKLFGIKSLETIFYNWFLKLSKDNSHSIDIKTLKNFFSGATTPQKSTLDKIIQVFPLIQKSKYFKFLLYKD